MPTATEPGGGSAAVSARAEARQWMAMATAWRRNGHRQIWADIPPREEAVTGFGPASDLAARTGSWQLRLEDDDLASLCTFAAGLAVAEADAWDDDQPHIATRAYADRRFLVGDRLVHWAVPWLDTVGRCYAVRNEAHGTRDLILGIADHHRPAPDLGGGHEGMYLPGHDSIGPVDFGGCAARAGSLLGGAVLFDVTLRSMTGNPEATRADLGDLVESHSFRRDLAVLYEVAAARWLRLADDHPGTARLWLDLASRAGVTCELLRS